MKLTSLFAALLFLQTLLRFTYACSCVPATLEQIYNRESTYSFVRARVIAEDSESSADSTRNRHLYALQVEKTYKGCTPSTSGQKGLLFLQSPKDSGICGISLKVGETYPIPISKGFLPEIGLCDSTFGNNFEGPAPFNKLTQKERAFLESRTVCCKGKCHSAGVKNCTE